MLSLKSVELLFFCAGGAVFGLSLFLSHSSWDFRQLTSDAKALPVTKLKVIMGWPLNGVKGTLWCCLLRFSFFQALELPYETDHLVFSRDPLTPTLRNSKVSGTVVKSGSIDETPEIGRKKISANHPNSRALESIVKVSLSTSFLHFIWSRLIMRRHFLPYKSVTSVSQTQYEGDGEQIFPENMFSPAVFYL